MSQIIKAFMGVFLTLFILDMENDTAAELYIFADTNIGR